MKTTEQMIAVMQHFVNGGKVEVKACGDDHWGRTYMPMWDWKTFDYRIAEEKPEITKLHCWVDDEGLVYHIVPGSVEDKASEASLTRLPQFDIEVTK